MHSSHSCRAYLLPLHVVSSSSSVVNVSVLSLGVSSVIFKFFYIYYHLSGMEMEKVHTENKHVPSRLVAVCPFRRLNVYL